MLLVTEQPATAAPLEPATTAAVCLQDNDCTAGELCLTGECNPPPLYIFLFSHGEDHINHELSEERFSRLIPVVEELSREYPRSTLSWTMQFMGADTAAMLERESASGIRTLIGSALDDDVFLIGYHGAHEPTPANSPLALLSPEEQGSWDPVVEASLAFLRFGRHPTLGVIDPTTSGGLELLQATFGAPDVISGFGGDSAQLAAQEQLASVPLMFGFPDHGPGYDADYATALKELMTALAPEPRTPGGLFWMDGKLRLNDGNPVDGVTTLQLEEGQSELLANLAARDGSRVQVLNASLASKYIYAAASPTDYAYDHPLAPELPEELLWTTTEREQRYANSAENLEYLAGPFLESLPGSRFVTARELRELFPDPAATPISRERLGAIVTELLRATTDRPPDFITVESDHYTLAESWYLITAALFSHQLHGQVPEQLEVQRQFGPLQEAAPLEQGVTLEGEAILDTVRTLFNRSSAVPPPGLLAAPGAPRRNGFEWTPATAIPHTLQVAGSSLNAAEFLLACATLLDRLERGEPTTAVSVAPLEMFSALHPLLATVAPPPFPGISWTLKPARLGGG